MLLFPVSVALATQVVLRNDTNTADTYDSSDQVAWLEYPECAVTVLTADAADLPLAIDFVYVYLGSNTGNQDGTETLTEVSLQILADGEDPSSSHMEWGPEAFYVNISSEYILELPLVDEANGLYALDYTSGRVAVWVCTPDPETGYSWPRTSERDTSGIVIDTSSPSAGNWLYYGSEVLPLSGFVAGSWIIRAAAGEGSGSGGDDTGGDTDGGDDTDDTDDGPVSIASVTPSTAKEGEAVSIAILGEGFEAGSTVFIGGLAVSNVQLSGDTALSGTSPSSLSAGTHDVLVNTPSGASDTLEGGFTVEGGGCGCSSGAGAWGLAGIVLAAGFAGRRRRVSPSA
ncbi:MAG: IPT/TIG domain-containing protein [Pseudomonadota bacterium]|nr:IPT/TIG domain-containing protein [Pseudomonadota bacterium]